MIHSPAMPYVHKPACYLEPQKLIEDMETKSSIVKSDQRCRAVGRTENLGASSAPRVGKGQFDQTQSPALAPQILRSFKDLPNMTKAY